MASTISGYLTQITAPSSWAVTKAAAFEAPRAVTWRRNNGGQRFGRMVAVVRSAPDKLSDKVVESVKEAEEKCSEDPKSGECVAAWDEVEELSAAASHARDRQKEKSDPLENYCKDNPETEECRTYDN